MANQLTKKLIVLFALTLALSGCGQLVVNGQILSPAQATAAENDRAHAQASTPTPAATSADVSFGGVSFNYDDSLATDVVGTIVPAEDSEGAPFWALSPEYVQFSFEGYALPDTFHEPRILVYPVEEFEALNPTAAKMIADLRYFLALRPSVPPAGGFEGEGIPLLPIFNAAQVMAAQMEYVNFQNGTGVRFLTQYDQARVEINNNELFYTYQGLTDDGAYYVAAVLPVSHPTLPGEATPFDAENFKAEDFDAYLTNTVAQLNAQAGASFAPDLGLLDALVRSLAVR